MLLTKMSYSIPGTWLGFIINESRYPVHSHNVGIF